MRDAHGHLDPGLFLVHLPPIPPTHPLPSSASTRLQVPEAYRSILLEGIGICYGFNAAAAVYARGIAAEKQEPVNFWSAKVFLLGGLALGELSEAVPAATKPRTGRGAGR